MSSPASLTASQTSALGCGDGAWRTASATATKAASSVVRCELGSVTRYATAKEEEPTGNAASAGGLRPNVGCQARSSHRRIVVPYAAP
jgi:hypothetical protein